MKLTHGALFKALLHIVVTGRGVTYNNSSQADSGRLGKKCLDFHLPYDKIEKSRKTAKQIWKKAKTV